MTKAKLFRGFADPSRLSVLEALRDGPRCVSDLIALTGLSQPNVSNHLACLRDCGLVVRQRDGKFFFYRLADDHVAELMQQVDGLLQELGLAIEACPNYLETGMQE